MFLNNDGQVEPNCEIAVIVLLDGAFGVRIKWLPERENILKQLYYLQRKRVRACDNIRRESASTQLSLRIDSVW